MRLQWPRTDQGYFSSVPISPYYTIIYYYKIYYTIITFVFFRDGCKKIFFLSMAVLLNKCSYNTSVLYEICPTIQKYSNSCLTRILDLQKHFYQNLKIKLTVI